MGLQLEKVIPWGRSFDEYLRIFALTETDLQRSILDCGGGPASFNAGMCDRGYPVVSCDPIYQFSAAEIHQRIQDTYSAVIEGVKASLDDYVWQDIASPEELGRVRMAAMQAFLADFEGDASGEVDRERYVNAELPHLPFGDSQFDLALCSHFLFTYSDLLSAEFHLESILELCRVAREVRIFPILDISGKLSPRFEPIAIELEKRGYQLEVRSVRYEFQKGGDRLLQVRSPN
ncbi:SAM-dependent methyltransferase [Oscillatoriales cyanobacterium LEGE 11467]|uniref:SAM-dependent methyltransferase n=1 Tax=Zarconia navalis LEGE 11467 TaxID=1828826 RepID=A0A928VYH6_9CYAN|nr:class I SAM-dependent methyltransferase [Zarconia navalis]MBE9042522.1 SAM-dependent methyltransferase [Zarconia navalis LEGE 11467]